MNNLVFRKKLGIAALFALLLVLASCGDSSSSSSISNGDGGATGLGGIEPVLFESLALQTDDAAVSLRWENPAYGGTIDPNYKEVEITATAVDGSDDREIVVTVPRGVTEYILKGLKANTAYIIAIKAVSMSGEKSVQRTRTITVGADTTAPKEELEGWEVEKIDTGTAEAPEPGIKVKWSTASLAEKDIEKVIVKITNTGDSSDKSKEAAATEGYVDFENLEGTATYKIEVEKYVDINGNEATILSAPDGLAAIVPDNIPAEVPAAIEGLKVEAKDAGGAAADESILVTWTDPGAGTVEVVVKDSYGREYAGTHTAGQYAVSGLYGIEEYHATARVFKGGRYSEAARAKGMTTDKTNDLELYSVHEPVPTDTTILVEWYPPLELKDYNGVRLTLTRPDPDDSASNIEEYEQVLAMNELEYTFTGLTASTADPAVSVTYKLKVETVDVAGNYNQVKKTGAADGLWETTTLTEAPAADETPPEVVSNIRAEINYLDLDTGLAGYMIRWNAGVDPDTADGSPVTSTGVKSYEVHIQMGDELVASETISALNLSYIVEDLKQGETYTVFVVAVDRAGNKLDRAAAGSVEFAVQDKPAAPEASAVTATAAADGPLGLEVALTPDNGYLYKVRLVEGETAHAIKYDAANVHFGVEDGIRAETAYTLKVSKMVSNGGAASGDISAEVDVEVAASAVPKASLARITLEYPAHRPQVGEGSVEFAPVLSIPDEDIDTLAAITYVYERSGGGEATLPEGIVFDPATGIFTIDLTNEISFIELDVTARAGATSVNYEADTSTTGSVAVGVVSGLGELRGVSFGDLPTTLTYGDPSITLGNYVQVDQTGIDAGLTYTADPAAVASISNGVFTAHQAGQVTVTVVASEAGFDAKTATVTITINKKTITAGDVVYTESSINAVVGASVNNSPTLHGGVTFDDLTFSGTLISGITLDVSNGTISGTATAPVAEATYTITASVPDENTKFTGSVDISMVIRVAYEFASIETYSDSDKTTAFADDVRKRESADSFTLYPQAEDSTGHEPADTTYAYESDDAAVLTVDSHGEVTIVGVGTATITITASNADYYNITDTVAITIEAALEYTTVETYTDSDRTTVFDDATHGARTYGDAAFTLYPKAEGGDGNEPAGTTYAYGSNNEATATVDSNGEVTIVGAGTAIITVTASHADYHDKTDTVTITVEKKELSDLGTVLSYATFSPKQGESSFVNPAVKVAGLRLADLTFTLADGVSLPQGLELNYGGNNGRVGGTPAEEPAQATYSIIVTAKSTSNKYKGSVTVKLTIEGYLVFTSLVVYTDSNYTTVFDDDIHGTKTGNNIGDKFRLYPRAFIGDATPHDTTYTFVSDKPNVVSITKITDSQFQFLQYGFGTIEGGGTATIAITASKEGYRNKEATVTITVTVSKTGIADIPDVTNKLTYPGTLPSGYVNEEITPISPTLTIPGLTLDDLTFAVKTDDDYSALPAGLQLNTASGEITGTPTEEIPHAIRYSVYATVSESHAKYKGSVEVIFRLQILSRKINLADEPELNTKLVYDLGTGYAGYVNEEIPPISPTLTIPGLTLDDLTFAVKTDTTLPAGLQLDEVSGKITGTPTNAATSDHFIVATVSESNIKYKGSAEIFVRIKVGAERKEMSELSALDLKYPPITATANREITFSPTMTRPLALALTDITFALKEGSALPAGLTLAADGTISGTPTKLGVQKFLLIATIKPENTKYKGSKEISVGVMITDILHEISSYTDSARTVSLDASAERTINEEFSIYVKAVDSDGNEAGDTIYVVALVPDTGGEATVVDGSASNEIKISFFEPGTVTVNITAKNPASTYKNGKLTVHSFNNVVEGSGSQ